MVAFRSILWQYRLHWTLTATSSHFLNRSACRAVVSYMPDVQVSFALPLHHVSLACVYVVTLLKLLSGIRASKSDTLEWCCAEVVTATSTRSLLSSSCPPFSLQHQNYSLAFVSQTRQEKASWQATKPRRSLSWTGLSSVVEWGTQVNSSSRANKCRTKNKQSFAL